MRQGKVIVFTIIGLVLLACGKDNNIADEPIIENFIFQDGLETQNNTLDELFPSNGNR